MRVSISSLTLLATTATASYIIQDDYQPSSFASMFDFWTGNDPTNGYVNYVSQEIAQNSGLYNVDNGTVFMGVDSKTTASGRGRDSIRISSKNTYNHGLIILDLAHMPAGECGTWPAFWLLGPNWPNSGEIDIIEGVNGGTTNSMAMHTNSGCSITNTGAFAGSLATPDCDVNAPNQATNAGCSIHTGNTQTYGAGFNAIGGGVYATEWTSEAINIWFFPRSAIPSDITSGNPSPENWGMPMGQFAGACNIDEHIFNQQIVFDVTFCGDWAGAVWNTDATCSSKASTCQAHVQNNPSAFQDTYWSINSLKVFQESGASQPSNSPGVPVPTVSPTSTTSTTTTATTFATVTSGFEPSSVISNTSTSGTFDTFTTVVTTNTDGPVPTSSESTSTTTISGTTSVYTTVYTTYTPGMSISSIPSSQATQTPVTQTPSAPSTTAAAAEAASTSSKSGSGWPWSGNWGWNHNNNHNQGSSSSFSSRWGDWNGGRRRWVYQA